MWDICRILFIDIVDLPGNYGGNLLLCHIGLYHE